MYNMWLCKIISRNQNEEGGIGGLEYIKIIYNDLLENQLEDFSRDYCKNNDFEFDKMIDSHYCLFKDSDYCLFFEDLVGEEDE